MAPHTQKLLLQDAQIGAISLKNRLVMAPLTRNRAGEGLVPTPLNVKYYQQRSTAGLIITEATQVSAQGIGYPGTPGIHSPEQVEGWKKVVEAVHKEGGKIFLQLWHVGRISHPSLQVDGKLPVAPSAIKPEGKAMTLKGWEDFVTPRALELDEIPGIVEQYAHGARMAKLAGFDGVEVHGANGYLLDQFLRDGTNKRTDRYGGPVENRARLLLEVVEAIVDVWGEGRVGVRLSPTGLFNDIVDSDPAATFTYVAEQLNRFSLAYIHTFEPFTQEFRVTPLIREVFKGSIIANGGFVQESAQKALDENEADFVAFGALFIANPDLPKRFAVGAELNAPDQSTFYGGGAEGYVDYPFLSE